MNLPLVLGHAGEEILYVLIPVALVLWLRNIALRRAERERASAQADGSDETPPDEADRGR